MFEMTSSRPMNSFSSRGTCVPSLSIAECPDGSRGLTKSLGCRLSPQRVHSWGSLSCSSELERTHGISSCVGDTPSPLVVGVFAAEYEDSGDISRRPSHCCSVTEMSLSSKSQKSSYWCLEGARRRNWAHNPCKLDRDAARQLTRAGLRVVDRQDRRR